MSKNIEEIKKIETKEEIITNSIKEKTIETYDKPKKIVEIKTEENIIIKNEKNEEEEDDEEEEKEEDDDNEKENEDKNNEKVNEQIKNDNEKNITKEDKTLEKEENKWIIIRSSL